jgi:glutamate synthase domain-containing protein 3
VRFFKVPLQKYTVLKDYQDDTILVDFEGSAGQSFAFATNGLSFKIHGNCNDYLGKGSEEN